MRYLTYLVEYFADPRVERLTEELGRGAELYPLRLLNHCLKHGIKDRVLHNYSAEKIAKICGYRRSGRLYAALIKCDFFLVRKTVSNAVQLCLKLDSNEFETHFQSNEIVDNELIQIRLGGGREGVAEGVPAAPADTPPAEAPLFPPHPLSTPLLSLNAVVFKDVKKKNKVKVLSGGGGAKKNSRSSEKWEIPSELKGLTLFERDGNLCRNFSVLYAEWKAVFPTLNLIQETKNAHTKLNTLVLAGERTGRAANVRWLASWFQNLARDAQTRGAHGKRRSEPAATQHVPGKYTAWSS